MDRLTGDIIGCAVELHRVLGSGLLETIYEQALGLELSTHGIHYERQVQVNIRYKDYFLHGQRLDLLVVGKWWWKSNQNQNYRTRPPPRCFPT